jgi:hypothetical protein
MIKHKRVIKYKAGHVHLGKKMQRVEYSLECGHRVLKDLEFGFYLNSIVALPCSQCNDDLPFFEKYSI